MDRIKYLHETNKNIIITGVPRSGKSTVAKKICTRLGYNLVQLDSLVEALKRAYPEFQVEMKKDGILEVIKFTPFLIEYLRELNDDPQRKKDINFVIEGSDIDLDEYFKHFSHDDFILVGLCYSNREATEIFETMKKYDNILDWSYYLSDDELLQYAESLFSRSKAYESLFLKYNIPYYDVSDNRNNILEKMEDNIVERIN